MKKFTYKATLEIELVQEVEENDIELMTEYDMNQSLVYLIKDAMACEVDSNVEVTYSELITE